MEKISLGLCLIFFLENIYAQRVIPDDLGGPRFIAWNNDYQYLSGFDNKQNTWSENLNYIGLGSNPENYLTIGGEGRWMYEYLNHASANLNPNDRNESVAQRLRFFEDLHFNKNFRLFLELGDNWAFDAEVPTPANYDAFDIQKLFFDYRFNLTDDINFSFRPGRFVMPLGSKIIVSTRDGSNVQYNYDGLRAWLNYKDHVKVDLFDDKTDQNLELKGIYVNSKLDNQRLSQPQLDVYYFDMHHDQRMLTNTFVEQNRKSIGARLFGRHKSFNYDLEYIQQFGKYGDQDIDAYAVFSNFGYTFKQNY
ncbi:alginate export family protein [Acinetobacter sp. ANC 3832]|uniref:alginate export family protein n=1 Tax=Acinetobacter sp. ANC 3832 TaxID=1977874 RepID=UPI00148A1D53|nr:alginate export family protein [Acinetobacter sp. ANC 3832]